MEDELIGPAVFESASLAGLTDTASNCYRPWIVLRSLLVTFCFYDVFSILDACRNSDVQAKRSMSRINSYKRDWSSSQESNGPSSSQGWAPPPPSAQDEAAKAEARARRLRAIEEAMSESKAESATALGKRNHPIDIDLLSSDDLPGPSATKRRVLPWETNTMHKPGGDRNFLVAPPAKPPPPIKPTAPAPIKLSSEQQHILKLVLGGDNVFFTGSAGTGKSVLLRQIISELRRKHTASDAVAVTASTGIAACNIGGITLHSFAGFGLGLEAPNVLAAKVRRSKKSMARWLRTQVLIIDEVSMVDGDLFDKLARLACLLRNNTKPFGGIQVVVTGDFFQLPPVMKGGQAKFAFEADLWSEVVKHTFNLTQVFRQKDPTFVNMLNEMRFGRLSQASIARFKKLERPLDFNDHIAATELFPRREDVDRANQLQLARLKDNPSYTFEAIDGGTADSDAREKLLANFMAVKSLKLSVGSQVMLIKNMDETLVNGSTGIVLSFVDSSSYRSEGTVAPKGSGVWFPVVRFKTIGTEGGFRDIPITADDFKVESPSREVLASRRQLPLILSWAMSIHKSQGQTLDRVKVDLGKVFEKGQAYVALSRATSLEGLQVLNFNPEKVMAHPKVTKWSETLQSVQC